MTVQQFFRINGGSTQLRGVTPDISFPLTVDSDEFGESSYDNALPWTSISTADYKRVADLKPSFRCWPEDMRYAPRRGGMEEFPGRNCRCQAYPSRKKLSLNEKVRTKERDDQEAKRKAREALAGGCDARTRIRRQGLDEATKRRRSRKSIASMSKLSTRWSSLRARTHKAASVLTDDGLQADERSIANPILSVKSNANPSATSSSMRPPRSSPTRWI